ncbi:MAG: hypothetical protein Q8L60_10435 [Gammaproteobacteria bacterium]|nr:hypothetical protein [Gammaproteobacteria bacterium]MDP2346766.1 hypothetical protein [Gammaproteobacteria bacterium]
MSPSRKKFERTAIEIWLWPESKLRKLPAENYADAEAESCWESWKAALGSHEEMAVFEITGDECSSGVSMMKIVELVRKYPAGTKFYTHPQAATPAARWRENGELDPHGKQYDCERAKLCGGHMTDDEIANAAFMQLHEPLGTATKERIRWLSRELVKATTKATPPVSVPESEYTCPGCEGAGRFRLPGVSYPCKRCDGKGWVESVLDRSGSMICQICKGNGSLPHSPQVTVLEICMNPRCWTKEMHDAWHGSIPDIQKAFESLLLAAKECEHVAATNTIHWDSHTEVGKPFCIKCGANPVPSAQTAAPDYAFKTIEEYEDILGVKVGEAFRIAWIMARTTNGMLDVLATKGPVQPAVSGICRVCKCTENDCSGCIERTGQPCWWVNEDLTLCSACAPDGHTTSANL